ncbi:MFS transporter [Streptomyces sp. NPDC056112]|uniref:MFS transporter n=1 Tax=Streptomyces sp. NPDC056112 TaxID=3345715 RepID=UPI0035DBAE28
MTPTAPAGPAAPGAAETARRSDDDRTPAGPLFVVLYTLAIFGVWMAINLPATVTVALRVSVLDPENQTTSYSIIAGVGALVAVIANPVFGRLSDRTRSRWGRRRPWIVVGLLGTTAGAALIALTSSLTLLVAGWMIMQCFVNAAVAGMLAIVADRFPERQHGLLGSISGATVTASVMVGTYFIDLFPTQILPQIGLPVALALVTCALLLPVMKEDDTRAEQPQPFGLKDLLGSFAINPRKSPDFAWFLVALFLMSISTVGLSTYHVYYMQNQLGIPAGRLPHILVIWSLLNGLASLVGAPLGGWLTDRLNRRKPVFAASAVIGAVSVVIIVISHSINVFLIGSTVEGLSYGILMGMYFAFATATMNDKSTIARDLGVTNIAVTLPFSLVPFLAPFVLRIGGHGDNYPLLFILGGAVGLLSLPFLLKIRATR